MGKNTFKSKQYQAPQSAMTFPDMKADYFKEVGALNNKEAVLNL